MTIQSILMVCRGNICRSPMAEGFFSRQLKDHGSSITVHSAGISALVNSPIDPNAFHIMQQHGMNLSEHRARQLTPEHLKKSDLIFVMTQSQLQEVQQSPIAVGKVFLLGHWQQYEIKDPYAHAVDAFETVYQQIEMAWSDWKSRIL